MKKKRSIGSYIIIALILFALWFYRDSMRDIVEGIQKISAKEFGICLLLASIYFFVDGLLIYLVAGNFSKKITVKSGIGITYACEFYRLITLGSAAFVAEIFYLCKEELTPGQATAVSAYKYTLKKASILVAGFLSFLGLKLMEKDTSYLEKYHLFVALALIISVTVIMGFLLISLSEKVAAAVIFLLQTLAKHVHGLEEAVSNWCQQINSINTHGKLLWRNFRCGIIAFVLYLVKCLVIYGVIVVLLSRYLAIPKEQIWALMALSYFLAGVIPAPSGVGSLEYVYGLFFGNYLGIGAMAPAILTFRFFTWIFPAMVGGLIVLCHRIYEKKKKNR